MVLVFDTHFDFKSIYCLPPLLTAYPKKNSSTHDWWPVSLALLLPSNTPACLVDWSERNSITDITLRGQSEKWLVSFSNLSSSAIIGLDHLKWLALGTEIAWTPSFIHVGLKDSLALIILDITLEKKQQQQQNSCSSFMWNQACHDQKRHSLLWVTTATLNCLSSGPPDMAPLPRCLAELRDSLLSGILFASIFPLEM